MWISLCVLASNVVTAPLIIMWLLAQLVVGFTKLVKMLFSASSSENFGWCYGAAVVCTMQTFKNPKAKQETSMSMNVTYCTDIWHDLSFATHSQSALNFILYITGLAQNGPTTYLTVLLPISILFSRSQLLVSGSYPFFIQEKSTPKLFIILKRARG